MQTLERYGPLAARVLLAALFIIAGAKKAMSFSGTAEAFGAMGLPFPEATVALVIAIELLGGFAVLIGWRVRWGAAALGLFSIAAALVAHTDFSAQGQMEQLLKNLGLAGGFLYLIIHGAGPFSLDERGRGSEIRRRERAEMSEQY